MSHPDRGGADEALTAQDEQDPRFVEDAVEKLNKVFEALDSNLRYQVTSQDGHVVVQLVEQDGKKVLYQLPPEGVLKVAAELREMVGLIVDRKI
ncbi:flagellar protein FlaG [Effusibacillus pohliae]|uniref:flagellar protein FlaG n=1 Tax=Effusibacillus pohliae TaxID=232270 RepID=UPI001B7FC79B|nr:flagellar protein FlaG [Effusibacillus pohliae]